ncbi:hypothetical protein ONE63_009360 [Megalurothrips usitatus]|uniref:Sema domain-containing protein n=1 Tax=Megalurothrips usitatus TaxID=439358 RepID=A0AAV7XN00_9NEOP|nr:hypothetical protein ONE63_009360 [Megalurothrips usitatus]
MAVLVALGALLLLHPTLADDILVKTFSDQGTERFNHLVVDKNTGRVFIGAVNKLYQLSPDLDLVIAETTGPKDDHPDCSVLLDCPANIVVKATDNVNKALVIDYTTTRLISCGSVYQGICHVRNLHNISDVSQIVKEAVVANNATASTVAFIAPGPPNPPVSQVMYVGVTYTGNSPYRSELPAVSSRSLDANNMFSIAETAVTTGTRQFLNSLARERYPIHYVYGFASEGFSYFMTVQMKTTSPSPYISKLVRVCHDDENYYSYTEIPIECEQPSGSGAPGKKYNLVQAAYVGKPGSDLAGDLGITAQDDVLFAVFAESDNSEGEVSIKPSSRSALCVYSLKSVRRKFMQNIKSCFSGNGTRGLDFISPSHPCVLTVSAEPLVGVRGQGSGVTAAAAALGSHFVSEPPGPQSASFLPRCTMYVFISPRCQPSRRELVPRGPVSHRSMSLNNYRTSEWRTARSVGARDPPRRQAVTDPPPHAGGGGVREEVELDISTAPKIRVRALVRCWLAPCASACHCVCVCVCVCV